MKGLVLLVLSFAFIGSGVFLIRRGCAMTSMDDRQFNIVPDFSNRTKMIGFGVGMIACGCLSGYAAFVAWFAP